MKVLLENPGQAGGRRIGEKQMKRVQTGIMSEFKFKRNKENAGYH